ncbi:ComEC/Rec2 family competence protein [Candidatus Dependentiae bacterium]|nr:ComEC/Rec2 family competence protein [Candidatus Dependentiae bacterium]
MNPLVSNFFAIPFTHSLLLFTLISIISIIAATQHYLSLLFSLYALTIGYVFYKNSLSYLMHIILMLFFSFLIITRIHNQQKEYLSHRHLLTVPIMIHGSIEQINHATLIKNQTTLIIKTEFIEYKRKKINIKKKIAIFFPTEKTDSLKEEDSISVYYITLNQPEHNSEYERYLIKENFWAVAHATIYTNFEHFSKEPSLKQQIINSFYHHLSTLSSSLFDPLFLGKKEKNEKSLIIQHQSMYWGIAHHMARSGAHLAILFGLIMLLLHYSQLPYFLRYTLCIFLLIGYGIISQNSISFLRALYMILFHIASKLCNHIPSSLHTLTITTFIILLFNPMQLFFLDFQLSFGITYIIIWLFNIKSTKTIAFYK